MRTPKCCLKYDSTRNFHYQIDNIIMPDRNSTTLLAKENFLDVKVNETNDKPPGQKSHPIIKYFLPHGLGNLTPLPENL